MFLILLLLFSSLHAVEKVELRLEHAHTEEARNWGLMARDSIPNDWGMLFLYDEDRVLSFWMYNTYVDLDLAYMDKWGVIQEIHSLKAYPEKMRRRHESPGELKRDGYDWQILSFFHEKTVFSKAPRRYALETRSGWLKKQGISLGDRMAWNGNMGAIFIKHEVKGPYHFDAEGFYPLISETEREVSLIGTEGSVVETVLLRAGTLYHPRRSFVEIRE